MEKMIAEMEEPRRNIFMETGVVEEEDK